MLGAPSVVYHACMKHIVIPSIVLFWSTTVHRYARNARDH